MNSPKLPASPGRLLGIDLFRLVAFAAIVLLHARGSRLSPIQDEAILQVSRFGVPFFFLVSGYFMGKQRPDPTGVLVSLLRRLVPVFVFWVAVYLLLHLVLYGSTGFIGVRALLVDGEPAYHLWFLPSLGISAVTFAVVDRYLGTRSALAVATILYSLGLYYVELGHSAPFSWNFRDGPFFGMIFIAIGYAIRRWGVEVSLANAALLSLVGLATQIGERLILWRFLGIPAHTSIDFFVGTVLFATGIFLAAMRIAPSGVLEKLAEWGSKTLGFYCIHLAFLWLIRLWIEPDGGVSVLMTTLIAVTLSVTSVLILVRIKPLSRLLQ